MPTTTHQPGWVRRVLDQPLLLLPAGILALALLVGMSFVVPGPGGAITWKSRFSTGFATGAFPTAVRIVFDEQSPAHPSNQPTIIALPDQAGAQDADASATARAYQVELTRSTQLRGWLLPAWGETITQRIITPISADEPQDTARIPALYADWLAQRPGEPGWAVRMAKDEEIITTRRVNPFAILVHVAVGVLPILLVRSVVVWSGARRRARRERARVCVRCQYALANLPTIAGACVCPECGTSNMYAL